MPRPTDTRMVNMPKMVLIDQRTVQAPEVSPDTEIRVHPDGLEYVYYNDELVGKRGFKIGLPNIYVHAEPGYPTGRCKMIKKSGERCKIGVRPGWPVCRAHGAGTINAPGGAPIITGRYSKFLPTLMMERYNDFLADGDVLNLRSEIALLDTRLSQMLARLETCDSNATWSKISRASMLLGKLMCEEEADTADVEIIRKLLVEAMSARDADAEIWHDAIIIIDQRRKLADTERRRIVDAKRFITAEEASAMMAFVVDTIAKNVSSPLERRRISEQFKQFAQRSNALGVQILDEATYNNDSAIDADDGDDVVVDAEASNEASS